MTPSAPRSYGKRGARFTLAFMLASLAAWLIAGLACAPSTPDEAVAEQTSLPADIGQVTPGTPAKNPNQSMASPTQPVGFNLQVQNNTSIYCLAATMADPNGSSVSTGATYRLEPCSTGAGQMFVWSHGLLQHTSGGCLASSYFEGSPLVVMACPTSAPPANVNNAAPTTMSWQVSADTNVLYHTNPNDGQSWAAVLSDPNDVTSQVVSAGLNSTEQLHVALTTNSNSAPLHIYTNENPARCLTESNNSVTVTACSKTAANQAWRLVASQIVGASNRCLTSGTAPNNAVVMANCLTNIDASTASSGQLWYVSYGFITNAAAGFVINPNSLVLDTSSATGLAITNYAAAASTSWSIGAVNPYL